MLVLCIRIGEAFYADDQRVQLIDFDGKYARLKTQGKFFCIGSEPISLPGNSDVKLIAGIRKERAIRIGIKAPIRIQILRERLYRQTQLHSQSSGIKPPNRFFQRGMACRACKGRMATLMEGQWVECPARRNLRLPVCEP